MAQSNETFVSVPVVQSSFLNSDLQKLAIDVSGTELEQQFSVPGQYVKMVLGANDPVYFSIASAPAASPRFEFLIRLSGAAADDLRALKVGDSVSVSAVAGAGFPLQKAQGKDLVLMAIGTGIAPIRSVIDQIVQKRADYGSVTLYYGARTSEDLVFAEQFEGWKAAGITVKGCLSGSDENQWQGHRVYVQKALKNDGPSLNGAIAFLCGKKDMVEGAKEALLSLGLAAEDIHLNF